MLDQLMLDETAIAADQGHSASPSATNAESPFTYHRCVDLRRNVPSILKREITLRLAPGVSTLAQMQMMRTTVTGIAKDQAGVDLRKDVGIIARGP
jgi:hypothetical protein